MSYKQKNFFHVSSQQTAARQTISTTYTELTGSKVNINSMAKSQSDLVYQYSFYLATIYNIPSGGSYEKPFLHIKLQKSNDNFVSNIVDVTDCQFNASGDTTENNDYYYMTYQPLFIVNTGPTYLRLVARSYSTSNRADLHRSYYFDGGSTEVVYPPSLLVMEV